MIAAHDLEVVVGSRTLMSGVSFRVDTGDRVGLVGRNGAGKTTLTKVLMSEFAPEGGTVTRSGSVGYLPQDPRTGDPKATGKERILSARNLDVLSRRMRKAEEQMSSPDEKTMTKAIEKYPRIEAEFVAAGGYAAESEALTIAANLGLDADLLEQELQTLSGGQRRRVELARILFEGPDIMILDEPTNHLDAESVLWLRDYLKAYAGGLIIISHDLDLIEEVVNKVFFLDGNRQVIDIYSMNYKQYLKQREADERPDAASAPTSRRRPQRSTRRLTRCARRPRRRWPRRTWPNAPSGCCRASKPNAPPTRSRTCGSPLPPHAAGCR